MKKIILLSFIVISLAISSKAQLYYSFTSNSSSFDEITNGSVPTLIGNGTDPLADEGYATNIPIGFTFIFNKNNSYNEVSVSTNGFISLTDLTSSYTDNNLSNGANGERPIFAPLWDDLSIQSLSNLTYETSGSAPYRKFTVQWLNVRWGLGATDGAVSFQVILYETTNEVEFLYRQESGNPISPSASVGITSSTSGNDNFFSLSNLSSNPSISSTIETKDISTKPSSNQSFLFRPMGVTPLSITHISAIKDKNANIITWQTANENNSAGFHLQRSLNGIEFSTINSQRSKAISGASNNNLNYSANDNTPAQATNYYRIKQIDNDGKIYYSKVVTIKNGTAFWASLNIYPNPVTDKLNLQVYCNSNTDATINIYNANAQQVLQQKQHFTSDANAIVQIPVSQLAKGLYTVKIINNRTNEVITKQFVK